MSKTIKLTRGMVTVVEDDLFDYLNQRNWNAHFDGKKWYAECRIDGEYTKMHRLIMNAKEGEQIDHMDGDGLNNLRSNLRKCTVLQNNQNAKIRKDNTSGFKGVTFSKGAYKAEIRVNRGRVYLGRFSKAEDAARAYDEAAVKYFGEFARTNAQEGRL